MIDHYSVKFRQPGPAVDRAAVADCERQLGITFPQPYVAFLLTCNGGSPSPAYLPGEGRPVKRFYSVGEDGIAENCERLRTAHGVPDNFVPIALLGGREAYMLLDCSDPCAGRLLCWSELKYGFRYQNEEFSNVTTLYLGIAELFFKFGPAKNRMDRDGMFCRLFDASATPGRGSRLAAELVAHGYDVNFVLPMHRHPIFPAIDWEVFSVAATLLSLGTRLDHVDPRHPDATIEQQLLEAQTRWTWLLGVSRANRYETGKGMAKRRLDDIEAALEIIRGRSGK